MTPRLALVLAALAAPATAQWLHMPQPYPVSDLPRQLALGDLDDDGHTDAVVLCDGLEPDPQAQLTVLLGAADGFGSALSFPIIAQTQDVALADVTGDGLLDVVTTNWIFLEVAVYAGNGSGGLLPPTVTPVGLKVQDLTLGDLDLDGDADAVATSGLQGTLRVLLGGGGVLTPAGQVFVGNNLALPSIALLNGDGLPDVLVRIASGGGGSLRLLPGLGGGALGLPLLALAGPRDAYALADLDGDDDLDVASCRADIVETAHNDGEGAFTVHYSQILGDGFLGIAAPDLDGDGAADIVAGEGFGDALRLLRGDGDGGFTPGPWLLQPGGTQAMLAADIDGDGRPDVCSLSPTEDLLYLARANDARLRLEPGAAAAAGKSPRDLVLGDLDGDDDLDAVYLSTDNDLLQRSLGDGAGGFGGHQGVDTGDAAVAVDLGDLDGDGHLDALVAHVLGQGLWTFFGDGAGHFTPGPTTPALFVNSDVLLREADGDGQLDALVVSEAAPEAMVLAGDGAGGFAPGALLALPSPARLAAGDFDGDSALDLVTAQTGALDVIVWLQQGGGFVAQTGVRTGAPGAAPLVADLDGDGQQDVALAVGSDYLASSLALLRGDGAGGLQPPEYLGAPHFERLAAADLNGDGRPDLAGVGHVAAVDQLHVLAADEDGGFTSASVMIDTAGDDGLALADLDGDGRRDAAHLNASDQLLRVSLNVSAPHPWHDLGSALAGSSGLPQLAGVSWAEPGTPGALRLTSAAPLALALLFISPVSTPTAFKGGVLVPVPPVLSLALATGAHGELSLAWAAWPALSPGEDWYFQAAVADGGAPKGVALSNALKLVQP